MKGRLLVLVSIILLSLVGCGEAKLKIIETKVISESWEERKPENNELRGMIGYRSGEISLPVETVRVYSSYEITNKIEELADTNRKTAWISKSSNLDESLIFPLYALIRTTKVKRKDLLPYAIDILPGLAKDEKSFKIYNRPKRVRFEFYLVPVYYAKNVDEDSYTILERIRMTYSLVVELKDEICWQRLNINMTDEEYPRGGGCTGRLVIEDVYPGITNLTAISEIRFIYRETNEE